MEEMAMNDMQEFQGVSEKCFTLIRYSYSDLVLIIDHIQAFLGSYRYRTWDDFWNKRRSVIDSNISSLMQGYDSWINNWTKIYPKHATQDRKTKPSLRIDQNARLDSSSTSVSSILTLRLPRITVFPWPHLWLFLETSKQALYLFVSSPGSLIS